MFRTGIGVDVHRLAPGRAMTVAGLVFPDEVGPEGHSDGDVVAHAACDALLSAAGLGDLGSNYGTTDPRWSGAPGVDFLTETAVRVRAAGYEIGNVDVTIILERPKIKDVVEEMRTRMAAALAIDRTCVSVKGKTNEGMDAVGRGEAVAAHAIALLRSHP